MITLYFRYHRQTTGYFRNLFKISRYNVPIRNAIIIPSAEQSDVIAEMDKGSNVIVNAVAGAGKTTLILELAKACEDKRILCVMYNARLKDETRRKTSGLSNLEVHSYHAAGCKYYSRDAKDDRGLCRIYEEAMRPNAPINFDIIVLDECQDLRPELFSFVYKLQKDNVRPAQLLLLGDPRQNIFKFLSADGRFLTRGASIFSRFNDRDRQWAHMTLTTTYRLTGT